MAVARQVFGCSGHEFLPRVGVNHLQVVARDTWPWIRAHVALRALALNSEHNGQ